MPFFAEINQTVIITLILLASAFTGNCQDKPAQNNKSFPS